MPWWRRSRTLRNQLAVDCLVALVCVVPPSTESTLQLAGQLGTRGEPVRNRVRAMANVSAHISKTPLPLPLYISTFPTLVQGPPSFQERLNGSSRGQHGGSVAYYKLHYIDCCQLALLYMTQQRARTPRPWRHHGTPAVLYTSPKLVLTGSRVLLPTNGNLIIRTLKNSGISISLNH